MRQHKFFILLISILVSATIVANFVMGKRTVFLTGEFLFSFDYLGHVKNILQNYLFSRENFFKQSQCSGCPSFYHVSSWYMLWVFSFLSIGQIVRIAPFLFYLLVNIVVQLFFLYLFVKLIIGKFKVWPFLIASAFFIFAPHKVYLIPSATLDGVIYGLMVGAITLLVFIFNHLSNFKTKQIILYSIFLGLILSFFLNIAISHLPIIFYTVFTISLLYTFKIIRSKNLSKMIFVFAPVLIVVIILNLPIVLSQLLTGDKYLLTDFNVLSWFDGLTAGSILAKANPILTGLFFLITIGLLSVSKISLYKKCGILLAYFLLAFLLTGGRIGNFSLYQYVFSYFPLMGYMRSLYRFIFFEILIIFIILYLGLKQLFEVRKGIIQSIGLIISLFLVFFLGQSALSQADRFSSGLLPEDYFRAARYLNSKSEKKIYFPTYGPSGNETMSGNYIWFRNKKSSPTLYSNPFTSLFAVSDLVYTEGYQLDSPWEGQLRALINYQNSPEEIRSYLSNLRIKYLVLDKNYLWNKNFPDFDLSKFTQTLVLDKEFGNISIYQIPDSSTECRPSYGDFIVGYCYDLQNPSFLINKTPKDYVLDKLVINNSTSVIQRNKRVRIPDIIVNPDIRLKLIEQKILVPFRVYQADNMVENIFVKKLQAGSYKLYFPILKLSAADRIFKNTQVEVQLDGRVIQRFLPYSAYHGMFWEEVSLDINKPSVLSIGTKGEGSVVFGNPLLFESSQTKEIADEILRYSNLPIISTYGSQTDDLQMQIDGNNIQQNEKYLSTVEVDFLQERYTQNSKFQQDFQRYENFQDTNQAFTTKNSRTVLEHVIGSNKRVEKLEFIIGSAFLDSEELGTLKVLDSFDKPVFQSSIFQKDKYLVTIPVSQKFLDRVGNNFKVQLEINKTGVLLYRFVAKVKF